ncbi:MAG: 4-hydroxy-tetrahydrodipicolinate reductase [Candidatus Cloacimonetes bacterium]|nr:4-hydroxy-tetrahydrodipicolinate reductase [Candidatus Cloacimonadota bacterium]
MIKIAIIGYGQMGKLIEELAPLNNCEVVSIIDPIIETEIMEETVSKADVCLEFTTPESVFSNIQKIAKAGKNLVVGTTGWFDRLDEVKELINKNNIGLVYGSNFSLGMNLFFSIVDTTTKLMNHVSDYDVFGLEMHHNKKKDSPSGTAEILSDIVLKNYENKKIAQFDRVNRKIESNEFHFASVRAGNIPGTHMIGFDSNADSIELKHTARNRKGFALGALKAACWIKDKKGIYNFREIFSEIIVT